MKRPRIVFSALLLLWGAFALSAQQTPPQAAEEAPEEAGQEDAPPQAAEEAPQPGQPSRREMLLRDSLEKDLATADTDQLRAWCRILSLESSGNKEALLRRLREYYGLSPASSSGMPPSGSGMRILIESADRSEYLKVELPDGVTESMVRLFGNVLVTVREEDRNRVHHVKADSLVFNQAQNSITASGNIRYTVDTGGRKENFTGDTLTFTVTDWTGVIFQGTSEREQNIDGKKVNFFFRGDSITRAAEDILVLENGAISSHDAPNPDYALKARKIWITGPGEWGLFSATLYVGHVPVLYLPFYWKSGNRLLFHPVAGSRTRSGYFINTTTYILGRSEQDDSFSILGFGDSAGGDYQQKRQGLFLVSLPGQAEAETQRATLKFMMDYYTSIGFMTGFMGNFPRLGKNASLDFYATLGVSRSVDNQGNPYFNNGSATRVYWNSSFLGPYRVPLRWGSYFNSRFSQWHIKFGWYSDPYYLNDFGHRQENFDWLTFLLSETGPDSSAGAPSASESMLWEVKGSQMFQPENTAPWLGSLGLASFRSALNWGSKTNQDVAASADPDKNYSPARNFFYPDKLVLPDIRLSLQGAAPLWTVARSSAETSGSAEASVKPEKETSLVRPDYIKSFNSLYSAQLLEAYLRYSLQLQFYMEDRTNHSVWLAPSDMDFSFEPARLTTTQQSSISYGVDFWDHLVKVSGNTKLSGFYQTHGAVFGTDGTVSSVDQLADLKYSRFLWDNSFQLTFFPLQGLPMFSRSSLQYSFDANIYNYRLSDTATVNNPRYNGLWIGGKDFVRRHEAAARAEWNAGPFSAAAVFSGFLYPLDERFSASWNLGFQNNGWKTGISQQTVYSGNTWTAQPLNADIQWKGFDNELSVSQNVRYNLNESHWEQTSTTLQAWGFKTVFNAAWRAQYSWDNLSYTWIPGSRTFAPSRLQFAYSRNITPRPLWKNRLRLSTVLGVSWNIDLRQPTSNVLSFKWTQKLKLYKFLDLKFSIASANSSMYLYFKPWREELGIDQPYNFFLDLLKSFNIFNTQDRIDSQFNMSSMNLELVHHLRNWDLSISYSGRPSLDSGAGVYRWKSEFSLYAKWNSLPMFNQRTRLKDDTWSVDSFQSDS
ncbi:MAG: hypothetical protein CSA76_01605 [Spirochaetales bacterium]|nr:MAG: hypothetical protein CSA76_01605 [Spirochaetales bacterium]